MKVFLQFNEGGREIDFKITITEYSINWLAIKYIPGNIDY